MLVLVCWCVGVWVCGCVGVLVCVSMLVCVCVCVCVGVWVCGWVGGCVPTPRKKDTFHIKGEHCVSSCQRY